MPSVGKPSSYYKAKDRNMPTMVSGTRANRIPIPSSQKANKMKAVAKCVPCKHEDLSSVCVLDLGEKRTCCCALAVSALGK